MTHRNGATLIEVLIAIFVLQCLLASRLKSPTFDETGQYQFVIESQNCTASVRRTRSYSLVSRLGDEPPPTPSATAAKPAPAPRPAHDCSDAGLPERLEVRPSRKLMRPGESFEFRTSVVDAKGCPLPVTPTWHVTSGASLLSVTAPGRVTTNPNR